MKLAVSFLIVSIFISGGRKCVAQNGYTPEILSGKTKPELYGGDVGLQKEAYDAFIKMSSAAKKEGINIQVVSGYRSFSRQKSIWNRKYKSYTDQGMAPLAAMKKIIEYSTYPGTSRHHWGTDIDIIDAAASYSGSVLEPEKFSGNGPFCKLKQWMDEHAEDYGFYLVYTEDPERKGFYYEPWHYSYKPISAPMLRAYRELDIPKRIKSEQLMGHQHMTPAFIDRYLKENILGINPVLK